MCGIAGFVCKDEYDKSLDAIFPLMGMAMDSRGGQAWGYTDGTRIHKEIGELQDSWSPEFSGAKQAAIHTRFGTVGKNTPENAHPWDFGDGFIGMHNGVVDNHYELNARYKRNCDVDSQNLLLHIKEGRDLAEVEAYGTVVFWRNGVLHLGCFNGGDLDVAKTPWGLVFASTDWAIRNAFRITGTAQPEFFYKIDEGVLYFVKDGELYISNEEKLNVGERTKTNTWKDGFSILDSFNKPVANPARNGSTLITGDCNWCGNDSKELFDGKDGLLCDGCYRFAGMDDTASGYPGIDVDEDGDEVLYDLMTVRQYCATKEITDLPFDDPCMTSCDECSVTLVADDNIYLERGQHIDFIICTRCRDMAAWKAKMEAKDAAEDEAEMLHITFPN